MKNIICSFILILAYSAQAEVLYDKCDKFKASCFSLTKDNSGNYKLFLDGIILLSTKNYFKAALAKIPKNTSFELRLNSHGGFVETGDRIRLMLDSKCKKKGFYGLGKDICRECEVTTIVKNEDHCDSACVGLYGIGSIKAFEKNSLFGFHRATFMNASKAGTYRYRGAGGETRVRIVTEESMAETGRVRMEKSLRDWDLSESWIKYLAINGIIERQKISQFTPSEMIDSNLFKKSELKLCSEK